MRLTQKWTRFCGLVCWIMVLAVRLAASDPLTELWEQWPIEQDPEEFFPTQPLSQAPEKAELEQQPQVQDMYQHWQMRQSHDKERYELQQRHQRQWEHLYAQQAMERQTMHDWQPPHNYYYGQPGQQERRAIPSHLSPYQPPKQRPKIDCAPSEIPSLGYDQPTEAISSNTRKRKPESVEELDASALRPKSVKFVTLSQSEQEIAWSIRTTTPIKTIETRTLLASLVDHGVLMNAANSDSFEGVNALRHRSLYRPPFRVLAYLALTEGYQARKEALKKLDKVCDNRKDQAREFINRLDQYNDSHEGYNAFGILLQDFMAADIVAKGISKPILKTLENSIDYVTKLIENKDQ